jgi:hypothetical protein
MKQKQIYQLPLFLIMCMIIFLSCSKQGPTGTIGATGPVGPVGPVGPTGPKGDTGTANVIYSSWATVTFTGSGTFWTGQIAAPGVTQDIMDKGEVKTYFKFGSEVYDGTYSNIPTGHSIYQYLTVGDINLVATFNATYPWRYIIIPGGVLGSMFNGKGYSKASDLSLNSGSTSQRSALDSMNYEEVCKKLNIPQ